MAIAPLHPAMGRGAVAVAAVCAAWLLCGLAEPPDPESLPSSLHGQASIETPGGGPPRLHINAQVRGSAPHGLTTTAIDVRHGRLILPDLLLLEPDAPNREHHVEARLDTTSQAAVLIADRAVALYRPWICASVEPESTCNRYRTLTLRRGALGGMRFGGISIEPIPACTAPIDDSIVIGMQALTAFESAIFDWDRKQMHLVVRRTLYSPIEPPSREGLDALSRRSEWSTVPMVVGASTETFDELRHVMISTQSMRPRVVVRVDSHPYTALIDTGYEGDVLLRAGLEWPVDRSAASPPPVALATADLANGRLSAPLTLGRCTFANVTVTTGWSPPEEFDRLHIDAVIGMGLLSRRPLWLDFSSGVLRVWNGEGDLPPTAIQP